MQNSKKEVEKRSWWKGLSEETKIEIVKSLLIFCGYLSVFYIGGKITEMRTTSGISRLNADGFLRFFNPETGLEVSIVESNKLIAQHYGMKK